MARILDLGLIFDQNPLNCCSISTKGCMLKDFVNLFYPDTCASCGSMLMATETSVCNYCIDELGLASLEFNPSPELMKRFWGRLEVEGLSVLFNYVKGAKSQKLIRSFKYGGNKKLGKYLGVQLGIQIAKGTKQVPDVIVPIPIHPKKRRIRGFNQTEIIADGIAQVLKIPVVSDALKREQHISSQTRKNRTERWKGLQKAYSINNICSVEGKSILLVDDILTTGATIEKCGSELLDNGSHHIDVALLAAAVD